MAAPIVMGGKEGELDASLSSDDGSTLTVSSKKAIFVIPIDPKSEDAESNRKRQKTSKGPKPSPKSGGVKAKKKSVPVSKGAKLQVWFDIQVQ